MRIFQKHNNNVFEKEYPIGITSFPNVILSRTQNWINTTLYSYIYKIYFIYSLYFLDNLSFIILNIYMYNNVTITLNVLEREMNTAAG